MPDIRSYKPGVTGSNPVPPTRESFSESQALLTTHQAFDIFDSRF